MKFDNILKYAESHFPKKEKLCVLFIKIMTCDVAGSWDMKMFIPFCEHLKSLAWEF